MYLEQNNLFYPYQFGFRNEHSTTHALIKITEKNPRSLFACGVYLDLKKDFCTVNHKLWNRRDC